MKITWDKENSDPYTAVGNYIGEHFGWYKTYIVRIKESNLGISNEYVTPDDYFSGDFVWENDWWEGGEVELLGVIAIEDIEVPPLKE